MPSCMFFRLISWGTEPTIWPLLEKISCSKDIEEIKMYEVLTLNCLCRDNRLGQTKQVVVKEIRLINF